MGKRGPARTPTSILKLRGSRLADERADAPPAQPGMPDRPEWLSEPAKIEWDKQITLLSARKLIAKAYGNALAMFCEAWATYTDACEKISESGPVTVGAKGNLVIHPMVRVKNEAFDRCLKLGRQFGFSPASQSEVQATDGEKNEGKSRFFAS